MARPKPQDSKLPFNWSKTTSVFLAGKAYDPVYGPAARADIVEIMRQPKCEEAAKFLYSASDGRWNLYIEVLNKAIAACMGVRTMVRLRSKVAPKASASHAIRRIAEVATEISERTPAQKFSVYGFAASRTKDEYPHPRIDNDTIIASLRIVEDLLNSLTWQVKGSKATGRPVDGHRRSLVIYLTTLFRQNFGKPVSGAVGALVSATFPRNPTMTGKAVQEMLARK